MIVVAHQPEYLPWLGFFDKLIKCDLFVVLDNVQFQKGFINRNRVKTPDGEQWLTVPIVHKFHRSPIYQVKIHNNKKWKKDNWFTILHNYSRAPYFKDYAKFFEKTFTSSWETLLDLDIHLINYLMSELNIKIPIRLASSLNPEGKGTELLIDICKKVGADTYLSGEGGKLYMDLNRFKDEGIKVIFQDFKHPEYPQQFSKTGFLPRMSIIDLLFNCGREKSVNIIRGI
ncbi:MAG: hypothetical protein CMI54_03630 [Parcubacteria group bacterium]|nr:hypothetical protein [Parcubacteria group bacterium]|tara:strand:- start:11528 stop:12214 length:687 start_codon:yes stop_codon:yes gene_type:complete